MKKVFFLTGVILSVVWSSCTKQKTENEPATAGMYSETYQSGGTIVTIKKSDLFTTIINSYLAISTALINDDASAASKAANEFVGNISRLDLSKLSDVDKSKVKELLDVAKEHGEHISKSEIDHQREHLERLTKNITDLITLIGADQTLYQQFCPMYQNNKGGFWLSASQEVLNPLFGTEMQKCGYVKQTYKAQ